eukprot:PITA_09594
MKEGTSITDNLNTFNTLLVQLESIEVKFESEDKAITLLCSFPESWDHFVTSISLSSSETFEFDDVVASLLSEETRKRSNLETSTSKAMMVRGRYKERHFNRHNDSRSKSKGKNSKVKCWFCGKSGHLKKDSWKQQQTSKEDSLTEKKEAKTTDTGSASSSEGIVDRSGGYNLLCDKLITINDNRMQNSSRGMERLWDPTTHKIIINRDVKFNEPSLAHLDVDNKLKQENVSDFQHIQFETSSHDSQGEHSSDTYHEQGSDVDHEHVSDVDHEEVPTDSNQPIVEVLETSLGRSTRMKRPPKRYDDYVTSVAFTANDDEPFCYQEVVEGFKREKWKAIMKDEMMALDKNGTWDPVELPKDRKIVGCKWVFKLKRGIDDTEDRYKARLVAKGFFSKSRH